ncbi:MAG: hypothetical protein U0797_12285 [Gemmataceae bacterium]
MPLVPELLRDVGFRPAATVPARQQHDHLLFEGDRLTGLVDYAAARMDGVAAGPGADARQPGRRRRRGVWVGLAAYPRGWRRCRSTRSVWRGGSTAPA